MRAKLVILSVLFCMLSCKDNQSSSEKSTFSTNRTNQNPSLTILEKIAQSHGFEQWNKVNKIQFTFNVDRDSAHFERNWSWHPKRHKVRSIIANDTVSYNLSSKIDSIFTRIDKGFINDKYWLLAPFNLVWDQENFNYTHDSIAIAPISNKEMQKITIVYKNEGGYTPGDAYDFYFEDDLLIKEWSFRAQNAATPSLITSWEGYRDFRGIKIATEHIRAQGNWKLYFTDIVIE